MLNSSVVSPRKSIVNNTDDDANNDEENGSLTTSYASMEVSSSNDEEDDDNIRSVLTTDGIHDKPGFVVVCLIIFVGDMARGVMFPSLWPLVQTLGGTHVTLGYTVSAFSFGRIIVNPLFGSWSIMYGYTRTLLCSVSILFVGALMYGQVQNVGRPEFIIIAQTLLGIGSGTLGVTRAFVADVTAKRSRTTYMAWVTSVQYAGCTVSPAFGALFNQTLQNVDLKYGLFRINMFTAPAYLLATAALITLVIMKISFQGRNRIEVSKDLGSSGSDPSKKKSKRRQAIEALAKTVVCFNLTVYECCLIGCMILAISPEGTMASFETVGVSFAETHFEMTSSDAGFIVSVCGSFGVLSLLLIGYFLFRYKKTSDVFLISLGMCNMIVGIASLIGIEEGGDTPPWRFMFGIFMIYSVGCPIAHTAVIGLFSKIVGRQPQGTIMGWFVSAGSLARMAFPIISGYVVHYVDINTLFIVLASILSSSLLGVWLHCRTFQKLAG